ncbi:hypothetical protein COU91_03330 [Candidatus Saccharibacteria bacterium CG10_big_fil_rev_8_21_14_0_10_47_8]|nr:MAG: hypothetical protein COU91_03330 [Candidatus Saccharibacteria bacterium CG10_big_fil_rev_8_21_14_0_10_47_8]
MPPQNNIKADITSPTHTSLVESGILTAGEQMVFIVRRHLIGILIIYLEALAGIGALLAFAYLVFSSFFNSLSPDAYRLVLAAVVLAMAFLVFILFVATYIYRQSRLLVTDKNLIQIVQRGLFSRKVSRLSMANVEDASAEQRGILATILNYGTLTVQTAGERENFVFYYCPTPDKFASGIIEAHQAYVDSLQED